MWGRDDPGRPSAGFAYAAAVPPRMGGGMPAVKMLQSGSLAMASVASYAEIPFYSQVAANVCGTE